MSIPKGEKFWRFETFSWWICILWWSQQGIYVIKEHRMPNYAVPGLMKAGDRYMNVQKIKSRLEKHIEVIFESSYITEIVEYWWGKEEFLMMPFLSLSEYCRFMLMVVQLKVKERLIKFTEQIHFPLYIANLCYVDWPLFFLFWLDVVELFTWNYDQIWYSWHELLKIVVEHEWMHIIKSNFMFIAKNYYS